LALLKDLGENLYLARKSAKITRKELAERANVSEYTLMDIEHGKHFGRVDTLLLVADALDVSIDYLLGRKKFYEKHNGIGD
jgi:transcriptional regulator with XRE-family HTH domain